MSAGPAIVIKPDLWGKRVEVEIQPPTSAVSLRSFATRAEAVKFAFDLAALKGWEVQDLGEAGCSQ